MKKQLLNDLVSLMRISEKVFFEIFENELSLILDQLKTEILDGVNESVFHAFREVVMHEGGHEQSWLMAKGENSPYIVIEMLNRLSWEKKIQSLLIDLGLSLNPLIPYDFKAIALEVLLQADNVELEINKKIIRFSQLNKFCLLLDRPIQEKIFLSTDGVDHLFPIPFSLEGKVELLKQAAKNKAVENTFILVQRFLIKLSQRPGCGNGDLQNIIENGKRVFQVIEELKENSYRCDSVVDDIYKDTKSNLISADDYIVLWDQEITFCKNSSYQHTIAEVLRIVLLTNEFQVPDRKIRSEVLAFYRAVLKISGRSIIGLSAGVLYVEHGTTSRPSLFYLGRDSILGKGCIIDGVGGSVILSESFIGGGFMPILIHTHKHIKIEKESAINERKNILSCLFFSSHGSRLPMSAVGLFESADYINKSSPYEGISIFSLCLEEEKSETLPCKN